MLLFIHLFLSLLLLSFFSFYTKGSTIYQKITLSTNKNSANNFIAAWEILRVCVWSLVQFNLHAEYCICKIGLKLPGKLLRFVVRFHFFFFRLKVGVLWYLIRLECTFMCACARLDLIQRTYVNVIDLYIPRSQNFPLTECHKVICFFLYMYSICCGKLEKY